MTTNKKAAPAGTGTASNTYDQAKSTQQSRIRLLPLSCTIATYPTPPALSAEEICRTAAPLSSHCFPDAKEGADILEAPKRDGLPIVLSWPDGVRVAISCHVTAHEVVAIYRLAREHIEAGYRRMAKRKGGRA